MGRPQVISEEQMELNVESLVEAILAKQAATPQFTNDEYAVFVENFADYLADNGLDFNALVPPGLSSGELNNASTNFINDGWSFGTEGITVTHRNDQQEQSFVGTATSDGTDGWTYTTPDGETIDVAATFGDLSNAVEFDPEDFFTEFMSGDSGDFIEYEMSEESKIAFWDLMSAINPVYDQYQKWWDTQYTEDMAVPSFETFANDPDQVALYAGEIPNEEDFNDPLAYWAAIEEWNEMLADGYQDRIAAAGNLYDNDPVLGWLASNSDFGFGEEPQPYVDSNAQGGLISLAQGGRVPAPPGIGGLGAAQQSQSAEGIDSLLPGQSPQMPIENADIYEIVKDDPILMGAAMAILGQHSDPHAAIEQAVSKYGEEIVQALVQAVSQQGALQGPGDGLSDSIPATIDGQQPAKLSSGEFVIPADVVSHLGNGDSQSGAGALQQMMSRARGDRTGNAGSPPAIDPGMVMPV